jgi:predicted 2-oxoglutarate/Fe(II)-dependent dioxygenase YbiX
MTRTFLSRPDSYSGGDLYVALGVDPYVMLEMTRTFLSRPDNYSGSCLFVTLRVTRTLHWG